MLKLYDYLPSQNAYKVRMLLEYLGLQYELVPVSIFTGESRSAAFLSKNPVGAVPVLEVGPGQYIAESNAILCYLAHGSSFWPSQRFAQAKVMQWLFFEQYYVEPNIGTIRFWTLTNRLGAHRSLVSAKREGGERALNALERQLAERPFLVEDTFSIADIACFAYMHVAEQGGFDLASYPGIWTWIERVKRQFKRVPAVHSYDASALAQ
jgi:glutathione S-transferase